MAHYYITDTHWIYKSVGARKVKKIYPFFKRRWISDEEYKSMEARIPKILLPMIRRKFPVLYGPVEIVGVTPLSPIMRNAFNLRYRHKFRYSAPRNKTTIPLTTLKDGGEIIFHSNNFSEILFEMSTHNLRMD
jgi:hypothetical protein